MAWSAVLLAFLLTFVPHTSAFDCNNPNGERLQVHLVAHSHDDTGWQITVDQYYMYGVQYILDTVITELQQNQDRKFIYVEMAFFKRWWDQQNDKMKEIVKKLVKSKQLEFINGGWCMNDEASTHYNAIIDQMTLGLRFINDTFGPDARPTVAWQIDPFGHSAEQASLFSMMSFNGLFFGRIDYADKNKRLKEQRMEMMWRGSRNFEQSTQIFTGVLHNIYFPPRGFCYDQGCWDPPIQDDPNLYDENVKERVDAFVKLSCNQAKHYRTNNIVLTMGQDFNYQNAHHWFKNLDKLIKYVNKDGRVHTFYSTPSMYLKALHNSGKTFDLKTDDFFPYSHCPYCYWTGYFTSRPTLKGYIRESNKILQVCKQMEAILGSKVSKPSSDKLKRAMAVNQHHDAVTGTEKQQVTNDYAKRLYIGRKECQEVIGSFINHKSTRHQDQPLNLHFQSCDNLNVSYCPITESGKSVVINAYNPIARPTVVYFKVPVKYGQFVILDSNGIEMQTELLPSFQRKNIVIYEILFQASLPPMGYATFFLNGLKNNMKEKSSSTVSEISPNENFIENDKLRLEFSPQSGRLIRMIRKDTHLTLDVEQQFFWYEGSVGNKVSKQTSGAYIFRPNSAPRPVCAGNLARIEIVKNGLLQEARQTFGSFVSQVIRLYKLDDYAEFEHTIGPIPVKDKLGKEIITKFKTSVNNGDVFFTDANGREMKKRKRNFRETWKLDVKEPVTANYYPIDSRIFIKDSKAQITIMSDRSQGGTSMKNGEIEVMLHRRLLKDDFLGVGEALNEPGVDGRGLVTRGKHRVLLSTPEEAPRLHRKHGEAMMMDPVLSFARNPYTKDDWQNKFIQRYSALSRPLPENVHVLTMENIGKKNEMILRFDHLFAYGEDPLLSQAVTINLDGLFNDMVISSIIELNLSANQYLKDKDTWHWNMTVPLSANIHSRWYIPPRNIEFVLKPMEIRTFLATIKR